MVQYLLYRGGGDDIHLPDKDRNTPWHRAAFYGRLLVGNILLDERTDTHLQNNAGDTPLHLVASGHSDLGRHYLLDQEDDVLDREDDISIHAGDDGYRDPLNNRLELAKPLLFYGSEIHHENKLGDTPMIWCPSRMGQYEIVQLLLERRADIHHRNKVGDTPLLVAAAGGHLEVVRILIDKFSLFS